MTEPQTGRIFISYRRADSAGYAGRIYDRLAAHFKKDALFMDVDTIQAGLDFVDVLENAVQSCDVLVALIGTQWLNIKDEAGKRRLDNPEDFVRIEVAAALNRSIRVIPVLVDGTPMPNSNQLPGNLKSLARRNAVLVNHHSFHSDATRLIEQLELGLKAAEESKILKAKKIKEEEVQKKRQAEIENLLSQANIAFDLDDWELAKEKLAAALTLEPNHTQAQTRLAIIERKQQDIKEKSERESAKKAEKEKADAEKKAKYAKEAQEKRQIEIEKLLSQVDIAFDLKEWELAKEKLAAILMLEPDHVQAQIKLASAERKQREDKEKAERDAAEKVAKQKAEAEREAAEKADREAAEKVTHEKAEKARSSKEKTETEQKAKEEIKQLDKQKTEEEHIPIVELKDGLLNKEQANYYNQRSIFIWATVGIIGLFVLGTAIWGISYFTRTINSSSPAPESSVNETPGTLESPTVLETTNTNETEILNNFTSSDPTTFVNVTFGEPETLDPGAALTYTTHEPEIIQNVYETLVFYDDIYTDKFVPILAESWKTSDDGSVYIFKIRSGVKFHKGQDLTASDVAYTFQRGLLLGGYSNSQWLLAEPFLGAGIDDITGIVDDFASADDRESLLSNDPDILFAACERVKTAIVADDNSGTVTMTLAQPWGPFIPTIAQSLGSIIDEDWAIANGAWDGSCDTWQNYYAEPSETNPLSNIMNGTGPFKFDHWSHGEELVIVRNDNYWREPAKLERVVWKYIDEWSTRFAMMQAGEADVIAVSSAENSQMDALVGDDCVFDVAANVYLPCEVIDDNLPFRRYIGQPNLSHTDMFFTFDINPDTNYVGSGQLDGNGIPLDFFSDVHIRKAFAYCFDWDSYISEVYDSEAIQTPVIPLAGMPGYQADMPVYSYNPAKCEEEFKLADVDNDDIPAGEDNNDIWSVGFRFQAIYNEGNTTRQAVAEILARNINAINSKFIIETASLPWPTFLNTLRNAEGPFFVSGWSEDIHDAHNWYQLYVVGAYAGRQRMDTDLMATFQELVNDGVAETDPDVRSAIYADLNQLFYDEVPTILLATSTRHNFEQRWVLGRVSNPIFAGTYYYPIYKQ